VNGFGVEHERSAIRIPSREVMSIKPRKEFSLALREIDGCPLRKTEEQMKSRWNVTRFTAHVSLEHLLQRQMRKEQAVPDSTKPHQVLGYLPIFLSPALQ
jgi:hypothetical protein